MPCFQKKLLPPIRLVRWINPFSFHKYFNQVVKKYYLFYMLYGKSFLGLPSLGKYMKKVVLLILFLQAVFANNGSVFAYSMKKDSTWKAYYAYNAWAMRESFDHVRQQQRIRARGMQQPPVSHHAKITARR